MRTNVTHFAEYTGWSKSYIRKLVDENRTKMAVEKVGRVLYFDSVDLMNKIRRV